MSMSRRRTTNAIIVLLLLATAVFAGCSRPAPEPVDRPNLLVAVQGQVRLKRDGWSEYVSVGFGAPLHWSDLLEVDGKASLLCGDLSIASMSGRGSCPCPPAPGRLTYRGAYFRDPQAQKLRHVPYVLHPRNTLIASPDPVLRWHDTGATSYTVGLVRGAETIWSQSEVTTNSIPYPEDAPTLRPGNNYLLTVRDNETGKSSYDDPATGVGFRLLSKEERAVVEAERGRILGVRPLDESGRDLALAIYYASYMPSESEDRRMWGRARQLLESVAQRQQESPAVQLWLGDVLAASKLPIQARDAYQAAVKAAAALGDVESQAEAKAGLWRVTGDEGAWQEAVALYNRLGDRKRVKDLQKEKEQ